MRRALLLTIAILLGAAASARAGPLTVHLKFHQEGPAVSVATNGRYVLIRAPAGGSPTLLDERTGKRVTLPECANDPSGSGFEGPWFEWTNQGLGSALYQCPGTDIVLTSYTLHTGVTSTIDLGSASDCNQKFSPCQYPGPGGTDWMVVEAPNACNCGQQAWLRNIKTGSELALPDRATMNGVADLSSPTQTFNVCSPLPRLRVRISPHQDSTTANWLFGGDYGFIGSGIQTDYLGYSFTWRDSGAWLGDYAIGFDAAGTAYLEHCGSRLTRRLSTSQFTGNRSALILLSPASGGRTKLRGIFLKSLRQFTVPLPAALQSPNTQFVLSRRTLWAIADGEAWTAPGPTHPARR